MNGVLEFIKRYSEYFIPKVIRTYRNSELRDSWVKSEDDYCKAMLGYGGIVAGVAFFATLYLDLNHPNPPDLFYALLGRGLLACLITAFSVILATSKKYQNIPGHFVISKLIFGVLIIYAFTYQYIYTMDFPDRNRFNSALIFMAGLFMLKVGPYFTNILFLTQFAIWYSIFHSSEFFFQDLQMQISIFIVSQLIMLHLVFSSKTFREKWISSKKEQVEAEKLGFVYASDQITSPLTVIATTCEKLKVIIDSHEKDLPQKEICRLRQLIELQEMNIHKLNNLSNLFSKRMKRTKKNRRVKKIGKIEDKIHSLYKKSKKAG